MHKSSLRLPALAVQLCLMAAAPGAAAQATAPNTAGSGHDHSSMAGHDMPTAAAAPVADHAMTSALGPYSMTREGSGTSWQPDATPMLGLHVRQGDWSVMAHGLVNAIYDRQTGPRGDDKAFTESMAMLMGNRPVGPGTLGLRAMVSLDPTMGKSGYPLLVPDRRDRRRHDAAGRPPASARLLHGARRPRTACTLGDDGAAFAYVGLPGEPALGPTAFMHRFSGMRNPGGAAHASLARLDPHHLRRRHRSASSQGPVAARRLLVQRPRARPVALEHRDAQASIRGRRGSRTTRCPSCRCRSATAT